MGFGLFKCRNGENSRDGWKIIKEFFQGVPALDVIDERLERYAGADEYRGAPQNVRVGMDGG